MRTPRRWKRRAVEKATLGPQLDDIHTSSDPTAPRYSGHDYLYSIK